MLVKIISGGQAGADRAALDAGLESGFPVGGYCPAGRTAEDGVIDARYPLEEIDGGYGERTRKNVQASDGTVLFYDAELSGGTLQTLLFCMEDKRPFRLIDRSLVDQARAVQAILQFTELRRIGILNVAGPRQSGSALIYDYVRQVMKGVIRSVNRQS